MKPLIGLDIGGTKCAVLLARAQDGITIDGKIRFDTETDKGFEHTLSRLYTAIDDMLTNHGLKPKEIEAFGISCGGPLDSRGGMILCPPNLPGWVNVPLADRIKARYGVPAFLQNDANACALVEWKLGAGRGTRNMVFLTMGTGMGAGIIAEGKLLRGHTDMGGEVGHLRLSEDGPVGFGKAGSFEGFASGGGIGRQARDLTRRLTGKGKPPQWTRDGIRDADITAELIAGYARAGDPDAIGLFAHVGDMLGRGLSLLVDTLNPECIVIGSIFARCEGLLRPAMEAALAREAIPFSLKRLRVVPAQFGEALGDMASVMVALHGLGVDPDTISPEQREKVLLHHQRLLTRHPELVDQGSNIWEAYELIKRCYLGGGKLLLAGNGGSCADAQHIVGELMKGFYLKRPLPEEEREMIAAATADTDLHAATHLQGALPAIALTDHAALSTAFANDVDAPLAFAQQIIGYGKPGDVFMGISTSGNARNVLLAAQVAKARGLSVLALTGGSGGRLAQVADVSIIAGGNCPAEVQELHLPIYHALCAMLESRFWGSRSR